jgi:phospholipase/carboxylesterase
MTYSLNTIVLEPLSKNKPKNAVILCHGYGGDGKDISILANYWRAHLPDTIFICPDAPEKCAASSSGFQWFDLMDQTPEQVLAKSLVAENKLNKLIDEVKKNNNLKASEIIIGGFSQGCMITLQTGLKRKDTVNSVIGYSGRIIDTNIYQKILILDQRLF